MRGGVIIIGSLLWDNDRREVWRKERLVISSGVLVDVPIYYGRLSSKRGNTYTMTFSPGVETGQGILVPFKNTLRDFSDLRIEAERLWQVEALSDSLGSLGAPWGCVGAIFNTQSNLRNWQHEWAKNFIQKINSPIHPVEAGGLLQIPWPVEVKSRTKAKFDVILGTATEASSPLPSVNQIVDAWCGQNDGREKYFFTNVRYGIKTVVDSGIWSRIQEKRPQWFEEWRSSKK